MCVIGWVCASLGVEPASMLEHDTPASVHTLADLSVLVGRDGDTLDTCDHAIRLNDSTSMDDATLERALSETLLESGVELEFVG
jgi:hypothetical protein